MTKAFFSFKAEAKRCILRTWDDVFAKFCKTFCYLRAIENKT